MRDRDGNIVRRLILSATSWLSGLPPPEFTEEKSTPELCQELEEEETHICRSFSDLPASQSQPEIETRNISTYIKNECGSNGIHTAKYTVLTFLPRTLYEQFRRVANAYFLLLVILQFIPALATYNPIISGAPLLIIVSITAAKDLVEDLRRQRTDRALNKLQASRLDISTGIVETCLWKDIGAGDMLVVSENEQVPADLVLVCSSAETAYVETASLDGESNLKPRLGISTAKNVSDFCKSLDSVPRLDAEVENPSPHLFSFSGTLYISGKDYPLSSDNLLLRGCRLRNTPWILGLVVYTGCETKAMLNLSVGSGWRKDTGIDAFPSKRSRIERQLNPQIILNFVLLLMLCFVCSLVEILGPGDPKQFLYGGSSWIINGIKSFFSSLILFQTVVPISLYVIVEIVKTSNAFFIQGDPNLFDARKGIGCVVRTWNLSDDLGQVEYIFTDKTGTLTQNVMTFIKMSANGQKYEEQKGKWQVPDDVSMFMQYISLCHTVVVSEEKEQGLTYAGQSADEVALVEGATAIGYIFLGIQNGVAKVRLPDGNIVEWEKLRVIEFSSERQKMSVIVRNEDGLLLICKGSDEAIFACLKEGERDTDVGRETYSHIIEWASTGLRTLCYAIRRLNEGDEEKEPEELEIDLELAGAIAVEDKLQDGVRHSISSFLRAGIRTWMLTGDRVETAISVARSCGLVPAGLSVATVGKPRKSEKGEKGEKDEEKDEKSNGKKCGLNGSGCSVLEEDCGLPCLTRESLVEILREGGIQCLAIEGITLKATLENAELKQLFLSAAIRCFAVICCRVSPLQKAAVVELVRGVSGAVTLAVGDGANDVSMLRKADIGVGISGGEGAQASMAADYSIPGFSFIMPLLFVHGRWSLHRVAGVTHASFYKNIAFVFVLFWYQFDCAFSTQFIYDYMFMLFYNLFFSVLPVLVLGLVDRDLDAKVALGIPELYPGGKSRNGYGILRFLGGVGEALYQSVICYLVPRAVYINNVIFWIGGVGGEDKIQVGSVMAFSVICSVNCTLFLMNRSWTVWTFVAILLSLIIVNGFFILFSIATYKSSLFGAASIVYFQPLFYATIIISVILSVSPRFLIQFIKETMFPTLLDAVRAAPATSHM